MQVRPYVVRGPDICLCEAEFCQHPPTHAQKALMFTDDDGQEWGQAAMVPISAMEAMEHIVDARLWDAYEMWHESSG